MASNSGKIRFVRCPKCLQLLVEYSNVSVYQCGGCGMVLKAKNKNGDEIEESSDVKLEETHNLNNNNTNLEIISPDNLSIFSTEQNNTNTPSSSNTHLSESDENEFRPVPQIPNPKNLNPPNCEKEETLIAQSVVSEEDTHSTIYDDGTRSVVSNAYDGGISSSDEGKQSVQKKTLTLAKSRRTFRKRVPTTSENSFKEKESGLPPRPPNERSNNNNSNKVTYTRNEIEQGVSLDSNDFEIIQSLLENDSPTPNLINKLKSLDKGERLRKMDELRSHLRKFSIKGGSDEKKYREKGIESNQRSYYQKPESQEAPLCFDSRHNSNYNTHQEKLPFYPYSPSRHSCACIHCTNTNGIYRPNPNISNLYAQSSYSDSPRSIDRDSMKSSFKEKRSIVRKHICRPILGATPFLICKNCFNLLQIPSTIIISRKRVTKVQCGNCSEVLTVPFPHHGSNNQKIIIDSHDNDVDFTRSYSSGIESVFDGLDDGKDASLHKLMGYNSATELLHSRTDFDVRHVKKW